MELNEKIRHLRLKNNMTLEQVGDLVGVGKSTVRKWESGDIANMRRDKIAKLATALGTSPAYLMGWDETSERTAPSVTDDVVRFPVLGEVAAGFDRIALTDWEGSTAEFPRSALGGRPVEDYLALRVCGDSMYPFYLDGDVVLVLRTPALERDGQVALVRYDGENATLKKVEQLQDGLRLVPLNPIYPPRTISGVDLEQCSILGIPRLLLRNVE
jgi:repressor LexA